MATNQPSPAGSSVQEYIVKVPKDTNKVYQVMKFNVTQKVDFKSWTNGQVKMERENNLKDFKEGEEMPKFGAGSEYGRDNREEARRKKYGIMTRKYNPDNQPWLLKVGGRNGKRYRGMKEGEVKRNADYYVFMNAPGGVFEAYPVEDWYNFVPVQSYKTLNAEEAEEEFGRRDKVMNFFSIMLKKRLKKEDDLDGEEEGEKKKTKKKKEKYGTGNGDLKISDMDEWINSSDEEREEDDEKSDDDGKKKKPKKGEAKKKKKKHDTDDEKEDDSGDGDGEGQELDYISDSSSEEEEEPEEKVKNQLKGVEDEEAIRIMENSEEDEEEEKKKEEEEKANKDKEEAGTTKNASKDKKDSKKEELSSDSGSDTSDSDDFDNDSNFQSAVFMQGNKKNKKEKSSPGGSGSTSRSNTPTKPLDKDGKKTSQGVKRKSPHIGTPSPNKHLAKKVKSESSPAVASGSQDQFSISTEGISEDSVRRYLMRKPMTTTELLQKFKSKKTGINKEQMVHTLTQILKKINPDKQTIKGKMYLSIKPSN